MYGHRAVTVAFIPSRARVLQYHIEPHFLFLFFRYADKNGPMGGCTDGLGAAQENSAAVDCCR